MRARRSALLIAGVAVAIGAIAAPAAAGPETPSGERGQIAKSKKGKKKAKQAAKKLTKAIKDSRFVGTRGDGAAVDHTYCASGKYRAQTRGTVFTGTSWKIIKATKKGDRLKGTIKGNAGFHVGMIKKGSKWRLGIAFPLPKGTSFGAVTRTDAAAECATL